MIRAHHTGGAVWCRKDHDHPPRATEQQLREACEAARIWDQILVIDAGEVRERGTHDELLTADGLCAELYRTQFARHPEHSAGGNDGKPATAGRRAVPGTQRPAPSNSQ
jgi:hypothetical protein